MHNEHLELILSMRNRGLSNYVIPGLDSHLLGGEGYGCVRLFQCSRDHEEKITPHSHRFDFSALVLRGNVTNFLWDESDRGDEFYVARMGYVEKPGDYFEVDAEVKRMTITSETTYYPGDMYHMKAAEIHSIQFSRDAMVLFFEGPKVSQTNVILEPFVNGVRVPTFKVEPWMFQRIPTLSNSSGE